MGMFKARLSFTAAAALLMIGQSVTAQLLPTSGDELPYEPELWNDGEYGTIQSGTGTYNYVLNVRNVDMPSVGWASPGEIAGTPDPYSSYLEDGNEQDFIDLMEADYVALGGSFEPIGKYDVCPEGTFKIAVYTEPWVDFVAYRQDPDGYWSYKPGGREVTRLDYSNNLISDPDSCDRMWYEYGIQYYNPIGFFAVSTVEIEE